MKVTYAPLHAFPWRDGELQLGEGVSIIERSGSDFRSVYAEFLDDWWAFEMPGAQYALRLEEGNFLRMRPSAIVQFFLFALWLVRRTPTQVRLKFYEDGGQPAAEKPLSMHLSRFEWNRLDAAPEFRFQAVDLQAINTLLTSLADIERTDGRLSFAVALALRACESYTWSVSALLHVSALEALLTYSQDPGITNRLARSYACLVGEDPQDRATEYEAFRRVYCLRSDLVHGRSHLHDDGDVNLRALQEAHIVAQTLWRKVLIDRQVQSQLEKDDEGRRTYLEPLIRSFNPGASGGAHP